MAVKTLVFSASDENRRRSLQEAALCASISHPNIVVGPLSGGGGVAPRSGRWFATLRPQPAHPRPLMQATYSSELQPLGTLGPKSNDSVGKGPGSGEPAAAGTADAGPSPMPMVRDLSRVLVGWAPGPNAVGVFGSGGAKRGLRKLPGGGARGGKAGAKRLVVVCIARRDRTRHA